MTCTANNICQCSSYQYHNFSALTCIDQQSYNGYCSVDFNCRVDKYLQCRNGLCQCVSPYSLWSNGYGTCIVPKTYNQYCFSSSDCDSTLNLKCHDGTENCVCPTNVNNNYCDCLRSVNNEYYWNGLNCIQAGGYGDSCTNDYNCQTLTYSLTCSTTTHTCGCSSNMVFNNIIGSCVSCATGIFLQHYLFLKRVL